MSAAPPLDGNAHEARSSSLERTAARQGALMVAAVLVVLLAVAAVDADPGCADVLYDTIVLGVLVQPKSITATAGSSAPSLPTARP